MWRAAHQYDPVALALADRHYSRISPGSEKFMPPGRMFVLVDDAAPALWGTSWPMAKYVNRVYPGAWVCTHFRREGGDRASDMIRAALALVRGHWGDPPPDGLISMIDKAKVRPTMVRGEPVYGWTWLKVGFELVGETVRRKYLIFRLPPDRFPPPAYLPGTRRLF